MTNLTINVLPALCLLATISLCAIAVAAETSQLWGERGEEWDPQGRLPDFSYAGYHRGEKSIPTIPQVASIKDFGAVGDGITDDTKAIQAAIAATPSGALFVPPGRYKITDFVRIEKSGLVLRGAGPDKSIFWFPQGLDELHPKVGRTSAGEATSGYSFGGAFLTLRGGYGAKPVTKITATARRGDTAVQVKQATDLTVGQTVQVRVQEDAAQSLKTFLYSGDPGDIAKGKPQDAKMLVRIAAIDGNQVRFDRPLRFDTRPEWQPEIRSIAPKVTESGIENLGFEFPPNKYRGHFKENGANAIELAQTYNCWVRNVSVHNGDMGVNILGAHNTVDGVTLTADPNRGLLAEGVAYWNGHHGIQLKHAEDNLITNFDLRAGYCHDLSVEHASGNVFSQGRGTNLNFDHHKDTSFQNLFTDIDCGAATRVWSSGGGESFGRHTASWATFWNIRSAQPFQLPRSGWGPPLMNFVGLNIEKLATRSPDGIWFEPFAPNQLQPRNLHLAQLQHRLNAPR